MKKVLWTILGVIVGLVVAIPLSFGIGFLMQLLLNPILTYFGLKTVTTLICTYIVLFIGLVKLMFK